MQTTRSINHINPAPQSITKYASISYLLFFIFAFWGPALGGFPLGFISIFPARFFAFVTWALVALWLKTNYRQLSLETLRNNWQLTFIGVWLGWALLSMVWVIDRGQGARDLFNMLIGLSLVGFAPLFLKDRPSLNRAAKIWLTTFTIFLVIAVIEHFTSSHLPISRFSHGFQPHLAYRPTAVFMNENNYATFLVLSFPFLLSRWRYFINWQARLLSGTGLVAGMYLLFVTGSKINFFVLAISICVYAFWLTPIPWMRKLKVFAILVLLAIGVWLFFSYTQPAIRGYLDLQFNEIAESNNNSMAIRLNLIRNGLSFFASTWGMGVGIGNFAPWIEQLAVYDTMETIRPHNWWIELMVEHGIFMTLGYLAFYFSLLWSAWKGWLTTKGRDRWIPEALTLGLVILPLAGVSPSSFLDFSPHWLLLALALSWHYIKKSGR